jgi:hypothetical protein
MREGVSEYGTPCHVEHVSMTVRTNLHRAEVGAMLRTYAMNDEYMNT